MFVQILMEKIVFDVIQMSSSAVLSLQKRGCEFKVESIPTEILDGVDYVVPLNKERISSQPSRVIKIDLKGKIQIIRQ